MRKNILWTIVLLVGIFSACTDKYVLNIHNEAIVLSAGIKADEDTRTILGEENNGVVPVYWNDEEDSEKFNVYLNGYESFPITFYKSEATQNAVTANFESDAVSSAVIPAGNHMARYPAKIPSQFIEQDGAVEKLKAYHIMEARFTTTEGQTWADVPSLEFKTKVAIVKLVLKNNDFKSQTLTNITIKSNNEEVVTSRNSSSIFAGDSEDGSVIVYFAIPEEAFSMTNVTLHATCDGNEYTASMEQEKTLVAGKLYKVNKTMEKVVLQMGNITAENAKIGDFAMVDGSFISRDVTLTAEQKANVRGIVFWTTKDTDLTDTGRKTPAKLTDDAIMALDFPNCTHGLIMSKWFQGSYKWQENATSISQWQNNNVSYNSSAGYKPIASDALETGFINYILGYQNTKILKAYNAYCKSVDGMNQNVVQLIETLAEWEKTNPAPKNTTGWFIPSVKEMFILSYKDVDNVAEQRTDYYPYTEIKQKVVASLTKCGWPNIYSAGYYNHTSTESSSDMNKVFSVMLYTKKTGVTTECSYNDNKALGKNFIAVCAF